MATIADKITGIAQHIDNAYDKVEEMGGILPDSKTTANLSDAIASIPSGGEQDITHIGITLTSTPTTLIDILNGTNIVSVNSDIKSVTSYAFSRQTKMKTLILNSVTSFINTGSLCANNSVLEHIEMDSLQELNSYHSGLFSGNTKLTYVSLAKLTTLVASTFSGCSSLTMEGLNLPSLTIISGSYPFMNTGVKRLYFDSLKTISAASAFYNTPYLEECDFPNLTTWSGNYSFDGTTSSVIKSVKIPQCSSIAAPFRNTSNLILIEIGSAMSKSFTLSSWSPTNALSSTSASLVDEGETFASNLEKLLYNIREHIAANLSTLTTEGYSITFSSAVYNAISADADTLAAFKNKNWSIVSA